jgi:hypothetical protein
MKKYRPLNQLVVLLPIQWPPISIHPQCPKHPQFLFQTWIWPLSQSLQNPIHKLLASVTEMQAIVPSAGVVRAISPALLIIIPPLPLITMIALMSHPTLPPTVLTRNFVPIMITMLVVIIHMADPVHLIAIHTLLLTLAPLTTVHALLLTPVVLTVVVVMTCTVDLVPSATVHALLITPAHLAAIHALLLAPVALAAVVMMTRVVELVPLITVHTLLLALVVLTMEVVVPCVAGPTCPTIILATPTQITARKVSLIHLCVVPAGPMVTVDHAISPVLQATALHCHQALTSKPSFNG